MRQLKSPSQDEQADDYGSRGIGIVEPGSVPHLGKERKQYSSTDHQ